MKLLNDLPYNEFIRIFGLDITFQDDNIKKYLYDLYNLNIESNYNFVVSDPVVRKKLIDLAFYFVLYRDYTLLGAVRQSIKKKLNMKIIPDECEYMIFKDACVGNIVPIVEIYLDYFKNHPYFYIFTCDVYKDVKIRNHVEVLKLLKAYGYEGIPEDNTVTTAYTNINEDKQTIKLKDLDKDRYNKNKIKN